MTGQGASAAWREKGIMPSRACCRWNGIQDGDLAVSNGRENNFKELFRNTMKYVSKEEYRNELRIAKFDQ
ncbi:hypothetical protein TNCV_1836811 [Trichonephila clavipes]|nr:hypothetical protein TNCV_1836811 [Trichonephila clavipes]